MAERYIEVTRLEGKSDERTAEINGRMYFIKKSGEVNESEIDHAIETIKSLQREGHDYHREINNYRILIE